MYFDIEHISAILCVRINVARIILCVRSAPDRMIAKRILSLREVSLSRLFLSSRVYFSANEHCTGRH